MRVVLLVIGWVLTFGAVANGAMALATLYFIGAGGFADWSMSVESLLTQHAPFLLWAKAVATSILPARLADFFFAAPALVVFPLRALVAGLLGRWALRAACGRNMQTA